MQVGFFGEVQVIVKRADGSVKLDTGFFPNVITNLGLDAIGNDNNSLFQYCAVGSGNSTPQHTDTRLDNYLAAGTQFTETSKYDYDPERDTEYYKCSKTVGYRFTGLNDQNVSEVGLVSSNEADTHQAYTRTLIKNDRGEPTTITVLQGEILELQYRLWQVFSVKDKDMVVNAIIDDVETPFNIKIRPAGFGGTNLEGSFNYNGIVGSAVSGNYNNSVGYGTGEIGAVSSTINDPTYEYYSRMNWKPYTPSSYKRRFTVYAGITQVNKSIRSFVFVTGLGAYQVRFGTVDGDEPINKTNQDTLQFEFEMSWGRFEGEI